MKKRLKRLLALWLALLMVVPMPMATYAATTYAITLPTNTEGYTVTSAQESPVEEGSGYSFTVTINDGYAASENFAVYANGTMINNGEIGYIEWKDMSSCICVINEVTEDLLITVTGVGKVNAITTSASSNGSYTVIYEESQITEAPEGASIAIVAEPDPGYELDAVTVTKTDDITTVVSVTDDYTFIMPAYPVTVNVTFTKETYSIIKSESQGGSYTVTAGGSEVTAAPEGEIVTIVATPDTGYELDTITVTKTEDTGDGITEVTVTDGSFTMPAYPVTVSVTFKTATYTITLPTDTVGYTVNSAQDSPVEHGSSYEFTVTIGDDYDASADFAVNANNSELTATNVSGNVYTYTIQSVTEAQVITVTGVKEIHAITTSDSTYGSYTVISEDGSDVTTALAGDKITIKPAASEGYELDTITVTKTEDSTIAVTVEDGTFTMPDYPVTVNVTFKKKTYDVTLPKDPIGYTVTSSQTSPVEHGDNYTFIVTINEGYDASENFAVKANGNPLTETYANGNVYTYTIENVTKNQEITVTGVVEKYGITKSETTGGSYAVTADGSEVTEAVKDTKVTITPTPAEGYEPDTVTVTKTGDSNTVVTVTDGSFTMPDYPVTVSVTFKKLTYEVTLPKETVGYTVTSSQTSPVEHGDNYTFIVTINDGYDASENFAVQANGNVLTATETGDNVYTYRIENVTGEQTVAVSGVEDLTAPTIKITLDENNWWENFMNKITFGLFFKEAKSLTIEASDKGSGIQSVKYYLTDTDFFPEDKNYTADEIESVITNWTEYTENIPLSEDKEYVLYAKAVDQAGNVSYASTMGIVLDTTVPVISGIENGGTYYGDTSFAVSDDYLKTVTVDDGEPVVVDSSTYSDTITADNSKHTVAAEDQAGNSVSYSISVYETYKVTLPEGTGYNVESSQASQVNYGSDYTFTVTIKDGYAASENFAVKANGNVLTATETGDNVYTYRIENITAKQTVTVTGVVEKYGITKSETTGGSYAVTADGSEVTEAIKDTKVTITPTPAEGYEPDTITVTKTGDSNTVVTVTDGSFTMPDYPVTVNVTFKKLTYEVTLPKETVGYTVESAQTSSVEHGSDYSFTVTINDGYAASENFAVQANGNPLTATETGDNVYTYRIENVTAKQTVTVTGVVEKYGIMKSETTGGSYAVTADGSEVTEAVKDTKVTITPTPAEGYEPDTVTVTKTGDSNTVVTVTDGSFTMPDYPVTVNVTFKKLTYEVTLPKETVGYTVESTQTSSVEHGSDYTFTVTINDGYAASENFAVKANGNVLTATETGDNVYTYRIENVTGEQTVAVSGVEDLTAPTIKITLDENNWWENLLNKITFGLFFKEAKSLTIEASDKGSGIQSVEYYLTDTDLFPEELEEDKIYTAQEIESVIPAWTTYTENTGSISLPEDDTYVLYAKTVDQAGNVSYASTTGIVIDTTAPVITGIENGGTYYGDIFFAISDDNLDTVTLDGETLKLTDATNSIIITADGDTHMIQASDKAGNQISYQVSVYEIWMRDGIASEGVYNLKPGIPYKLGSGKWKVVGDDTIYEGGNTFYVQESGTFEFQKQ